MKEAEVDEFFYNTAVLNLADNQAAIVSAKPQ